MIRALRAEWGKTFSILSPFLCLVGTVLLVVVTTATLGNDFVHGISTGEHPAQLTMRVTDVLGSAVQFGLLTFAAFAMTLITSEYSSGSIRSTFQAQPRRAVVLAGKTIIAAVLGLAAGCITGGLGLASGYLALNGHAAPHAEAPAVTVLRVGALFAVAAALVVAIGAIVRNAVGTLAIGAVLLVGMLALPPSISKWAPAGAAGQFLTASGTDYPPSIGLLVVVAWAAVAYTLASVLLHRRDA
jgi:ABC-2 type transport system permease protein